MKLLTVSILAVILRHTLIRGTKNVWIYKRYDK